MSENFLISDSLKDTLSRETLYKKDLTENCPVVLELRADIGRIELDILLEDVSIKQHVKLDEFIIDERKYKFRETVQFYLGRIYRNKENLLLSTIITNDKDFWRKLQ